MQYGVSSSNKLAQAIYEAREERETQQPSPMVQNDQYASVNELAALLRKYVTAN